MNNRMVWIALGLPLAAVNGAAVLRSLLGGEPLPWGNLAALALALWLVAAEARAWRRERSADE